MATNNPVNNCLVTKLTSSISGEMPRLGEFTVEFDTITNPTNKDMYLCVSYTETSAGAADYNGYVRLLTSGTLKEFSTSSPSGVDVGTQLDISDNRLHIIVVPNGGKVAVGNKYYLDNLSLFNSVATDILGTGGKLTHKKVKSDNLVYCTNLKVLSFNNATIVGELDLSLMNELTTVSLSNSTATLTADMFMKNYKLTTLQLQGSSVTGNFAPVFDRWGELLSQDTHAAAALFNKNHIRIWNTQATVNGTSYDNTQFFNIVFDNSGNWEIVFPS